MTTKNDALCLIWKFLWFLFKLKAQRLAVRATVRCEAAQMQRFLGPGIRQEKKKKTPRWSEKLKTVCVPLTADQVHRVQGPAPRGEASPLPERLQGWPLRSRKCNTIPVWFFCFLSRTKDKCITNITNGKSSLFRFFNSSSLLEIQTCSCHESTKAEQFVPDASAALYVCLCVCVVHQEVSSSQPLSFYIPQLTHIGVWERLIIRMICSYYGYNRPT